MKPLVFATSIAATALGVAAEAATSRPVTFDSGDERIVGELFLPDGYKEGDKLPAMEVTGAWMTVRQQMPAVYARQLADRGFAALTFDFRGWGESAGARRQFEDPKAKIASFAAPPGYSVDPGQVELFARAKQIQAEKPDMAWMDAVRQAQV